MKDSYQEDLMEDMQKHQLSYAMQQQTMQRMIRKIPTTTEGNR